MKFGIYIQNLEEIGVIVFEKCWKSAHVCWAMTITLRLMGSKVKIEKSVIAKNETDHSIFIHSHMLTDHIQHKFLYILAL